MSILLWTLSLLLGAVLLAALARRIKVPSPALFALGGVLLALLPHGPRISLQPDLALALFVAPVLVNAAFDNSLRDLRENWIPIASLVFMAVAVTTAAVALVARWLVPAMPWPVAVVLGAAVAPPDAAAATAVLKEVRLPYRIVAILEDESLLNDASALLIYRLAIGAAVAHTNNALAVASTLGFVLVGSIAVGALLAFTYGNIVSRFSDVPSAIVMQFIGAFGAWIVADLLSLSGVLVVVTFAVILSRAAIRPPAAVRVPSYAVWELAVFVLNALAFILVGLQIGPIMDRLNRTPHVHYVAFATAILVTVVLARAAWVFTFSLVRQLAHRVFGAGSPLPPPPPFKNSLLVSWCGMRGIVTLAAALALPDGSGSAPAFPYRDLIVLTAFAVVLGTLVMQGLTLRALVMMLGFDDDSPVDNEVRAGRVEMFKAALAIVDTHENDDAAAALRREYTDVLQQIDGSIGRSEREHQARVALRTAARTAARERLTALRDSGAIGESAFLQLEAELDLSELNQEARSRW
jgi:monovalent cation/hydrogen antiporter